MIGQLEVSRIDVNGVGHPLRLCQKAAKRNTAERCRLAMATVVPTYLAAASRRAHLYPLPRRSSMNRITSAFLLAALLPAATFAEIKTETIEYQDGDTTLKGQLVYDDSIEGKRPGIIVAHDMVGAERLRQEARRDAGRTRLRGLRGRHVRRRQGHQPCARRQGLDAADHRQRRRLASTRHGRLGDLEGQRTGRRRQARRGRLLLRRCHRDADGLCRR